MSIRIITSCIVLWLLSTTCLAGSSLIHAVGPDPLHRNRPARVAEVLQHVERDFGDYKVTVDFAELPQPLKPVYATVTLTYQADATDDSYASPRGLAFGFYRDQMEWVGERIVSFGSQWKEGDVRTVPIEFTPLQSRGELIIDWGQRDVDMNIAWCFDENGTLVHLGLSPAICDAVPMVFYEGDSIKILTPGPRSPKTNLIDANYTVVPPFRIGDTSTVCFHVTALRSFPTGFDMELIYNYMSPSGLPEAVKGPVSAGQTLDICVQVVPLAFRDLHELTLLIQPEEGRSDGEFNEEALPMCALFKDDGSLRYVTLSFLPSPEEQLSKSLPAGTLETCGRTKIDRNPRINDGALPGDDQ